MERAKITRNAVITASNSSKRFDFIDTWKPPVPPADCGMNCGKVRCYQANSPSPPIIFAPRSAMINRIILMMERKRLTAIENPKSGADWKVIL